MNALEQLSYLIDRFIDEAESLKDKIRPLDTDVWAEQGFTVTDKMLIENEKTMDVLDELDDLLFRLNELSDDITEIIN